MFKNQNMLFIRKIFLNCLVHFIAFFIALGLATASDMGCDLAYLLTVNELFACIILEIAVCFFAYKIYAYKKLDNKIMIIIYWVISIMQWEDIIKVHENLNYYNLFSNNCVDVASKAWNTAFPDQTFDEGLFPFGLKNQIKKIYGHFSINSLEICGIK